MLNFKNILLSYKIFLKVAVTIRLTNKIINIWKTQKELGCIFMILMNQIL